MVKVITTDDENDEERLVIGSFYLSKNSPFFPYATFGLFLKNVRKRRFERRNVMRRKRREVWQVKWANKKHFMVIIIITMINMPHTLMMDNVHAVENRKKQLNTSSQNVKMNIFKNKE